MRQAHKKVRNSLKYTNMKMARLWICPSNLTPTFCHHSKGVCVHCMCVRLPEPSERTQKVACTRADSKKKYRATVFFFFLLVNMFTHARLSSTYICPSLHWHTCLCVCVRACLAEERDLHIRNELQCGVKKNLYWIWLKSVCVRPRNWLLWRKRKKVVLLWWPKVK